MPARSTAAAEDPTAPHPTLQIGEVARRVDLSIRTIRHWEDMGLITPSARSSGGFRLYSEDDVARIRLLRFMKPLDITLEQMRELMQMRDQLAEGTDDASDRAGALVWPRSSTAGTDRARLAGLLAEYVDRADARLEKLRKQVVEVEEFVGRLRAEVREGAGVGAQPDPANHDVPLPRAETRVGVEHEPPVG